MKTLYLHIGTPKTATTAIQNFCWDNRQVLEKYGYCYPLFEYRFPNVQKYRNAHFLVGRIKDENRKRQFEQEQAVVSDGIGQILQLFEQYDNIILSDEGIWNRGFFEDTNCWKRIQNGLLSKGIVVKIIVYLRRQDDFLFSWWNQQVKEGMLRSSVMSWEEVTEQLPYIKLDYYDILTEISEYIGKENITVRVFDKKSFLGGSIYADFLNAIHLSYTEEYQILTPFQNPSLTKNNIEIKRILNTLPDLEKQENNYFRKVLTELSDQNIETARNSMFSEAENQKFLEKYKEGNARIAEEYLGRDGDLFHYAYQADEKWDMDNDKMIRDVISFFGTTTLHLMKENQDLKEQLELQKRHISNIRYKMRHPVKASLEKIKRAGRE